MRIIAIIFLLMFSGLLQAESLCFSPVKERKGDKSTKREKSQAFDYRVQVDAGPIIVPSSEESTKYEIHSEKPLVKIRLGEKVVESFHISRKMLDEGRNCIYFKNIYETWSVVEKWQAEKLCSCK